MGEREAEATVAVPFDDLAPGLRLVLRGDRPGDLEVTDRRPHLYASTYPSEIVTCRLADGTRLTVRCKYERPLTHDTHGHRGGVAYEAAVLEHVLRPLGVRTQRLLGTFSDPATGRTLAVFEYLPDAVRITDATDRSPVHAAARWIGGFHRASADLLRRSAPPLIRYDLAYYLGWVERTEKLARDRFDWLRALCRSADRPLSLLADATPCVIHGEVLLAERARPIGNGVADRLGDGGGRRRRDRPREPHGGVGHGHGRRVRG